MIFIASPFYFYPWLYVLKMDPDLDPKRRQTVTNTVDYPKNSVEHTCSFFLSSPSFSCITKFFLLKAHVI
jgi:hypothetical protein